MSVLVLVTAVWKQLLRSFSYDDFVIVQVRVFDVGNVALFGSTRELNNAPGHQIAQAIYELFVSQNVERRYPLYLSIV